MTKAVAEQKKHRPKRDLQGHWLPGETGNTTHGLTAVTPVALAVVVDAGADLATLAAYAEAAAEGLIELARRLNDDLPVKSAPDERKHARGNVLLGGLTRAAARFQVFATAARAGGVRAAPWGELSTELYNSHQARLAESLSILLSRLQHGYAWLLLAGVTSTDEESNGVYARALIEGVRALGNSAVEVMTSMAQARQWLLEREEDGESFMDRINRMVEESEAEYAAAAQEAGQKAEYAEGQ